MDLINLSKEASFTVSESYAPIVAEVTLSPILTYTASVKLDEVMAEQLKELRKGFNGFIARELKAWFDHKADQGYVASKPPAALKENEKAVLLEHLVEDTNVTKSVYSNGVIRISVGLPAAIVLKSGTPDAVLAQAFLSLRMKIAQVFKEAVDEYGIGSADQERKVTLQCISGTSSELGFDVELEV